LEARKPSPLDRLWRCDLTRQMHADTHGLSRREHPNPMNGAKAAYYTTVRQGSAQLNKQHTD